MSPNLHSSIFSFLNFHLFNTHFHLLQHFVTTPTNPNPFSKLQSYPCNLYDGNWELDSHKKPMYDETCPFHRNAWNCLRNKRENMERINEWKWRPRNCELQRIDPLRFLGIMRNKNVGFVGDSLNENFLVALLCVLRSGDTGATKWKRKGAWRGAYFPKFNVTVGYHRSVLLAKYQWGYDKFPKDKPLVFYESRNPVSPPLDMLDGFKLVLRNMASYIQKEIPNTALKFWRLQSPRHFHGGDWNQNGTRLFNDPLDKSELDSWFDPANNGVNKEARILNSIIKKTLQGTEIHLLDLSHLSEFREDAHPATWLGSKDAVEVWGQDCMHWCLPGLPDTWVDILAQLVQYSFH